MNIINTQAFVLKKKNSGETSFIVHLFSIDHGKIIVIAKGARTNKSKFHGFFEQFSLLNIHINYKEGRPYHFINSAEYIEPFWKLKNNPIAILYASIVTEVIYRTQKYYSDISIFKLLKAVFYEMNDNKISPQYLHWYFFIHFFKINGFGYNLEYCNHCHKKLTNGKISTKNGYLLCSNCSKNINSDLAFNSEILKIFSFMLKNHPKNLIDIKCSEKIRKMIDKLIWNTLKIHFDNLSHLNSIKTLNKMI
ncbi:MAG: DNA repair protein RecO [Candidatus Marinimicrobia bacterium]|nr:DNA repair protein RecO [Candidatus Neomarinimicrobiota bacterium]